MELEKKFAELRNYFAPMVNYFNMKKELKNAPDNKREELAKIIEKEEETCYDTINKINEILHSVD